MARDDKTIEFPRPRHPDDAAVYRAYMAAVKLLNLRSKGQFKFNHKTYESLEVVHRLCKKGGYRSPVTPAQLLDIRSDFM